MPHHTPEVPQNMALNHKVCAVCHAIFYRPTGISTARWNDRQTCGQHCGNVLASRSRWQCQPQEFVPESKVCPTCGKVFTRRPSQRLEHWKRITFCGQQCANTKAARAWRREQGIDPRIEMDPLCECGNAATVHVRVTTMSGGPGSQHATSGLLPLCNDCKQLFDEEEAARHIWGAVRPEPRKHHKPRKEWKT
jgi:hypothetical protein